MVAMNPEVSSVGEMSSCLGTPFFPSNAMCTNQNEAVATSELCSNVAFLPKSAVNSNPMVAMNTKISIVGDKSSCLGTPFCQAISCSQMRMRFLLQLTHAPM